MWVALLVFLPAAFSDPQARESPPTLFTHGAEATKRCSQILTRRGAEAPLPAPSSLLPFLSHPPLSAPPKSHFHTQSCFCSLPLPHEGMLCPGTGFSAGGLPAPLFAHPDPLPILRMCPPGVYMWVSIWGSLPEPAPPRRISPLRTGPSRQGQSRFPETACRNPKREGASEHVLRATALPSTHQHTHTPSPAQQARLLERKHSDGEDSSCGGEPPC